MSVYVGADWDKAKCRVEAEVAGKIVRDTVDRHPKAVCRWASELAPGEKLVVGIEAGDPLWVKLWERTGAEVYVFDPQKAKSYAKSLSSSKASDDKRSASTLRSQVQSEAHRASANRPLPAELRGMDRELDTQTTIRNETNRKTNRLNALLRQFHPALREALKELDGPATVRLIQAAPTPRAWLELSDAEQQNALKGFRKTRRAELQAALAEEWIQLTAAEEEAARYSMRQAAALLAILLKQRAEVEKRLEESARSNPVASTALSVEGIGPVISTGAALALANECDDRDTMAIRTGLAPVTVKSGTRGDRHPNVQMRRSAKSKLRVIAYMMATQLVQRHPWAKAQYAYYRAKGIDAPGSYRRVGRSFSRVLAALVRDKAQFDEQRYIDRLKDRGVPWASAL